MGNIVSWLNNIVVELCQFLAIVVISVGIWKSLKIYIKDAILGAESAAAIQESRLELGHSFSLGLGFLIGASILKTTLAPTWNEIGHLASIITIRTVLNYFLLKDIVVQTGQIQQKSKGRFLKAFKGYMQTHHGDEIKGTEGGEKTEGQESES